MSFTRPFVLTVCAGIPVNCSNIHCRDVLRVRLCAGVSSGGGDVCSYTLDKSREVSQESLCLNALSASIHFASFIQSVSYSVIPVGPAMSLVSYTFFPKIFFENLAKFLQQDSSLYLNAST